MIRAAKRGRLGRENSAAADHQPSEAGFSVTGSEVQGAGGLIAVRDYCPDAPSTRPAFLWVHGGGFSSGGLDQRESNEPARVLAASGVHVRTLAYRLAPRARLFTDPDLTEHPGRFPAGLDDVVDVAKDLHTRTGRPIHLGGASAGAALAAGTVLRLRDEGSSLVRSLFLGYGTMHAELPENPAIEADLRGPLARWAFNPAMTRQMNLNYVGDAALLVPGYAFPGGEDLHGFPPTLLIDARNDRLRRSGHAFADELRAEGVPVRRLVLGTGHGFLGNRRGRAFTRGLTELKAWLVTHD